MVELGKMVAYFDEMKDHPALAGTQIGRETVSPGDLRAMVRNLEEALGPSAKALRVPAGAAHSLEKPKIEASGESVAQETDKYLKSLAKVDSEGYDAFLREFVMAYWTNDEGKIRRLVTRQPELSSRLLKGYLDLLGAMAAHTNLESVSFKWSGAVSWNVPKLFDVLVALASFQSKFSKDSSPMAQVSSGLERIISACKEAGDRAEAAGHDNVAIDKYLQVASLAERFELAGVRAWVFASLSKLYYQSGDAVKARDFAEKAKAERSMGEK